MKILEGKNLVRSIDKECKMKWLLRFEKTGG
jgi:hypothetical protein